MVYAGILAHGTALSAAETARMIPQLSAPAIRQAMRWASDERRLAEACSAVLAFMQRHPIASTWGRSDLASSDMMSLETAQLAVDTHGYTDVAMTLARLLGFDLCPRLKALKDRHLFIARGTAVPEAIRSICHARIDVQKIVDHWESIVHLVASVHSGHTSAVHALARFGSASRGDPLYEAMVQLGKLLRTVFLADYFVNATFRRELLRVLNRGEAVNALKRAIYTGRVAGYQAKRDDEMQAVADALSLLANILMAWNTAQMHSALNRWNARRSTAAPPELIGRIAPTRTEGINLRGVFRFPIEQYLERLLPSRGVRNVAVGRP